MNPWTAIWFKPRQAIRAIVDANPKHWVIPLAVAAGIASMLLPMGWMVGAGMPRAVAMGVAVGMGAIGGVLWLYLFGWLYRLVGTWFGGRATNAQVRAAIAWAELPRLAVFGISLLAILGVVIRAQTASGPTAPGMPVWPFVLMGFSFIAWIWRVILASHTLGEVHRFSAWKGLGTLFIPNAVLVVPVFFIAMLAAIAIPNVIRARASANEFAAIGNLRVLITSLEMRRAIENNYPASTEWAALYPPATTPALGPAPFQTAGALSHHDVQGYRYTYTSTGATSYSLSATPMESGGMGTRSFFTDESGIIRHCRVQGPTIDTPAGPHDVPIDNSDSRLCGQKAE